MKAGTLGRLVSLISLGERSATHAAALVTEIMDLKCKNIDEAREVDIKSRFFEHRAVAVIKNKLCAIDHEFEDLGFGGWMPFRYIDQWLQFVSLERKLMAANNLICPCLLYTSDAADQRSSVDLGGRRIIKKKETRGIGVRSGKR